MRTADTVAPVTARDLPAIRRLIAGAVRHSVAHSDVEVAYLTDDIGVGLDAWRQHPAGALHLKCSRSGAIVGVVLVKEFWNLTNLFVDPEHQGQGIGRLLLNEVLDTCRTRSPRGALLVNSSTVATGFYEHLGFQQTGPGRDRPGGCVPSCGYTSPSAATSFAAESAAGTKLRRIVFGSDRMSPVTSSARKPGTSSPS